MGPKLIPAVNPSWPLTAWAGSRAGDGKEAEAWDRLTLFSFIFISFYLFLFYSFYLFYFSFFFYFAPRWSPGI